MKQKTIIAGLMYLMAFISCVACQRRWPLSIPRCDAGDLDCIPKTLTQLLRKSDEIPELNVPQIDPFYWRKTVILHTRNPKAPINIIIRNFNTTIYGLKNSEVIDVKGFGADPKTSKFEITSRVPYLVSESAYKSTMNLFSLPIQTEGISNTTLKNAEMRQIIDADVIMKNGKAYLNIKNVRINLKVSKLNIHFHSKTGNEQINDTVNKVVNDNWRDIFYEIKPDLEKSISEVITALIKPIFDEIPYEDFFLPKD